MNGGDSRKKIGELQLFPVAFNSSRNSTSWVSLKNETQESGSGYNIDFLVIQKPKSRTSLNRFASRLSLTALPWCLFMVTSVYLNYVLVSYNYFFVRPKSDLNWLFYLSIVCDTVYLLDVACAWLVYVKSMRAGAVMAKPRGVFSLILDTLFAFPYSYIYLSADTNTESTIFLALRCISFVRMYRLHLFFKRLEKSVSFHRHVIFYLKYFCYLFGVQHALACCWYLLACPIGCNEALNWARTLKNASYYPSTVGRWYFLSTYVALTGLARCGFGDVLPTNAYERIASVVAMCSAILFYAMYVSSAALLFLNGNCAKFRVQKRIRFILSRLKLAEVDERLVKATLRYFETFWTNKRGVLTTDALVLLPDEIRTKMDYLVNGQMLRRSVIFRSKPDAFLRKISPLMRHEFFTAGENIYVEGEIKHKMVIVKSGTVDVLSEEDHVTPIISFGAGTCLGEASLILCLPAAINLRAATYVETQALYMKDFLKVSSSYPDICRDVRTEVLRRMYKLAIVNRKSSRALKDLKEVLVARPSDLLDAEYSYPHVLSLYQYRDNVKRKVEGTWLAKAKFPCILNGNTKHMLAWESFVTACALFVAVMYPYFVAFEHGFPLWFEAVADVIHIIFVVDVYVLLTTAIVKRGYVLGTFRNILDERMDSVGFHLDVFASFYVEVFAYLAEDVDRFYYLLKLNRLLKVYRVSTLCHRLEHVLVANSLSIALVKYVVYVLLMAYWFSVAVYFQTCYYDSCVHNGWFINKIISGIQSRILTSTIKGKFLLSLYFGVSCTVKAGVGDVLPANLQDLAFVMCGLLLGDKPTFGKF